MGVLQWLDKHIEEVILVVLSAITVVVVFLQIVSRNLFSYSFIWAEELARYAFVWLIFIGVAYGVKRKSHISVEIVTLAFKQRGNLILSIIANTLFLVFTVLITYLSIIVIGKINRVSSAMHLPMELVYAAPVVGMLLASIRLIQELVSQFKKLGSDEEAGVKE